MKLRFAIAAVVLVTALSFAQEGPVDPNAPGSVSGVVLNRLGNYPVANVGLRLVPDDGIPDHQYDADSDGGGSFRFPSVAPGRYRLVYERAGYLPVNGNRSALRGVTIGVRADQDVGGIVLRMFQAAVIKGRIVDQRGQPVARASVQAMDETSNRGRRRVRIEGQAFTDDNGEFRVHSLPPGHYFVLAMRPQTEQDLRTASEQGERTVYVPTYYPNTSDSQMASAIDIRGGEEAPLQIMLQRAETVPVKGTVLVGGKVVARTGSVDFSQLGVSLTTPSGMAKVDTEGHFQTRLVPGTYRAKAYVTGPNGSAVGRQMVRIGREGAPDLTIATGSLSTLSVPVNIAWGRKTRTRGSPSMPTITLVPLLDNDDDEALSPVRGVADTHDTRRLVFQDIAPGRYELVAGGAGETYLNAYVSGTSYGGDGTPVVTINGESSRTVSVNVSLDGAEVSGTTLTPKGAPLGGATIVAVPDSRYRDRTSMYRVTYSDQSGKFTLHALAPGDYTLAAWDDIDDGAWFDPATAGDALSHGTKISVRESDRQQAQVTAIITRE